MYSKLKDFIYNIDGIPVKIQVVGREQDTDVVRISIPIKEGENEADCKSIDLLDSFNEYITIDGFADTGDGLATSESLKNDNDDTMNTTFENISMFNNTRLIDQTNTTLSEWEVISGVNSPEKSGLDVGKQQQLSDIKEEDHKSSSGISSSSSSSLRSPRSVTPAVTFSHHWGLPELRITERFVAGVVQETTDPSRFTVSIVFSFRYTSSKY
jgi:hypothetical protein